MPAYSNDDDPLLDPDELPPPNFASVLLVDLDVADEPEDVQRRAVTDWLATHEPSPSLIASLRRTDLLPTGGAGGRWVSRSDRRSDDERVDAFLARMARAHTLRELDELELDFQRVVAEARMRGEHYVALGELLAATVERGEPPRRGDEGVGSPDGASDAGST